MGHKRRKSRNPQQRTSLQRKVGSLQQLGHNLAEQRGALSCSQCLRKVLPRDLSSWVLEGRCVLVLPRPRQRAHDMRKTEEAQEHQTGDLANQFSQLIRLSGEVKVGGKAIDATHHLAYFKGFVFCLKCGCYCQNEPRELRQRCKQKPAPGMRFVLRCLLARRTPRRSLDWPKGFADIPGESGPPPPTPAAEVPAYFVKGSSQKNK